MAKIFKLKNFNYFFWTPLGSRVSIYINFCLQVQFKMTAAWYCTHYLPPVSTTPVVSLTPVENLPPVSTTLANLVEKPAAISPLVSLTPLANLPPVSLIPVVHLDLRLSLWIFEKNLKRSYCNTLGLGGNWFIKKTRSKKSRDTVPLRGYFKEKIHDTMSPLIRLLYAVASRRWLAMSITKTTQL